MAFCPFCRSPIPRDRWDALDDLYDDLDLDDLDLDDLDLEDLDDLDEGVIEITVPTDAHVDHAMLERVTGRRVVVHREDLPACDVTEVDGVRCTTPIRTCIDMAPRLDEDGLRRMVLDLLARGHLTVDAAWARLAQPDLQVHHGAELVRRMLRTLG